MNSQNRNADSDRRAVCKALLTVDQRDPDGEITRLPTRADLLHPTMEPTFLPSARLSPGLVHDHLHSHLLRWVQGVQRINFCNFLFGELQLTGQLLILTTGIIHSFLANLTHSEQKRRLLTKECDKNLWVWLFSQLQTEINSENCWVAGHVGVVFCVLLLVQSRTSDWERQCRLVIDDWPDYQHNY